MQQPWLTEVETDVENISGSWEKLSVSLIEYVIVMNWSSLLRYNMLIVVLSIDNTQYGVVKGRVSGRTEKSCCNIVMLTSILLQFAL
jgi:hypothetical protein